MRTYLHSQIFTKQSLPPVTNRLPTVLSPVLLTKLPGLALGAQLTLLTPSPCAFARITWSITLSRNSSTLTAPSLDAQASRQPASWGAQASKLTDAECRVDSKTFWKEEAELVATVVGEDRQMRTRPS